MFRFAALILLIACLTPVSAAGVSAAGNDDFERAAARYLQVLRRRPRQVTAFQFEDILARDREWELAVEWKDEPCDCNWFHHDVVRSGFVVLVQPPRVKLPLRIGRLHSFLSVLSTLFSLHGGAFGFEEKDSINP